MKTHTPGPWAYDKDSNEIFSCNEAHGCGWVALVKGNDSNGQPLPEEERQANAKLIAAAPELLAALRWIASNGYTAQAADMIDHSRAAIAKAEGAAK